MDSVAVKTTLTPHSEKKLKQTRLPFQLTRITSPKESAQPCKKQKLNDSDCVEVKENIAEKTNSNFLKSAEKQNFVVIDLCETTNSPVKVSETKDEKIDGANEKDDVQVLESSSNSSSNTIVNDISDKNDLNEKADEGAAEPPENKRKIDEEPDKDSTKRRKLSVDDKLQSFDETTSESSDEKKLENNCSSEDLDEAGKEGAVEKVELEASEETAILSQGKDCTNQEEEKDIEIIEEKQENGDVPASSPDVENDKEFNKTAIVTPERKKKDPSKDSGKKSAKKLTPKQKQREAEMAKRKTEREALQQEKERKKQEEREEKNRLKEEKEEQKKKLKEEREKKRQAEIDQKNEEKKKKEEEKMEALRRKEEEKRKKEEEKKRKEEQRLEEKRKREEELQKKKEEELQSKKKFTKEAEAFSSFFKKVDPKLSQEELKQTQIVFMPFTVKADMRLAPINRNPMDEARRKALEEAMKDQADCETYVFQLRCQDFVPKKSGNTWPAEEKYEEVVVVEDVAIKDAVPKTKCKNPKAKLLQFHENRRPPYWGTWRKKSKQIRSRQPFGQDKVFDYDVDSDDEWEEEEPGESLHGSDDEKEPEDDYEVDNDFFVPHGYLSEDENPEDETLSPETQKAKLKLLGEQFDQERNEKTKQLRPIVIGCVWFTSETDQPESVNSSVIKLLNKRKAVLWTDTVPIPTQGDEPDVSDGIQADAVTPTSTPKVKIPFPEAAVPDLIKLVHGNTKSRMTVVKTFLDIWNRDLCEEEAFSQLLSKACVSGKIKEIGIWQKNSEEGPLFGKLCWVVKKEIREKYNLVDWTGPPSSCADTEKVSEKSTTEKVIEIVDLDSAKKRPVSLITKFTKVLTEDERKTQLQNAKYKSPSTASDEKSSSVCKKSAKNLLQFWTNLPTTKETQQNDSEVEIIEHRVKKRVNLIPVVELPPLNLGTNEDEGEKMEVETKPEPNEESKNSKEESDREVEMKEGDVAVDKEKEKVNPQESIETGVKEDSIIEIDLEITSEKKGDANLKEENASTENNEALNTKMEVGCEKDNEEHSNNEDEKKSNVEKDLDQGDMKTESNKEIVNEEDCKTENGENPNSKEELKPAGDSTFKMETSSVTENKANKEEDQKVTEIPEKLENAESIKEKPIPVEKTDVNKDKKTEASNGEIKPVVKKRVAILKSWPNCAKTDKPNS